MTELLPPNRPLRAWELVALDSVVALAYAAVFLLSAPASIRIGWFWELAVTALTVGIAVRRSAPLPVFLVMFAVSVAMYVGGADVDSFFASAYVFYLVALRDRVRRKALTVTVATLSAAGLVLGLVAGGPMVGRQVSQAVLGAVALGTAWTLGRLVRDRRTARRVAAEQLAERAVLDERSRIARELHDIVAHSIGVIAVKAGVANHVMRAQPEEAENALRDIETTSRGALAEMRQLLGVLRAEPVELGAPPRVAGLPDLAARAETAGVRVELTVDGVGALPEGLDLTVYRIVQEALTNVTKHAAPASCRVVINGDGREVRVEVTDDGTRVSSGEGGHGLVGMRERVLMYGGSFAAGPRPDGGFAVSARLPYQPVPA
ncbi:sensor histidine kinase [Fodinicola feengrottensis]|uniref:histidine kinase n=1 Tax=Fodinicola feengrottensis TaxID=435914 RepID=A0ABN2GPY9_9ACTN